MIAKLKIKPSTYRVCEIKMVYLSFLFRREQMIGTGLRPNVMRLRENAFLIESEDHAMCDESSRLKGRSSSRRERPIASALLAGSTHQIKPNQLYFYCRSIKSVEFLRFDGIKSSLSRTKCLFSFVYRSEREIKGEEKMR